MQEKCYLIQDSTQKIYKKRIDNMETVIQGIMLGVTLAGTCLATCAPIYAPFMIMEDRTFMKNLYVAFQISLGRFITYSIFGAVAGFLGTQLSNEARNIATAI